MTRRNILRAAANGFGAVALESLLHRELGAAPRVNPLAAKPAHFEAKAKRVIFLFMVGAPSHIDTFDPKPALKKYEGQPLPESYGKVTSQFTDGTTPILASPWEFERYGHSGLPVSSLYPHLAKCVDDICFVRSFYTESVVHAPAMYQVHTGRILMGYPSMGSWVTYGLGSESENLPAYVVMPQPEGTPEGGTPCWGSGFLPAVYQGTPFRAAGTPVAHLATPGDIPPTARRNQLDLLNELNRSHLGRHPGSAELEARLGHYELAAKMQTAVPDVLDLSSET